MSTTTLDIDFVSDIACPWCAVGLHALEQALERVAPQVGARITLQPFELNPGMPPGGEDAVEHLAAKYGIGPEQIAANGAAIRERGAALGFRFGAQRKRVWNTRSAHRLLHWAGQQDAAAALRLKHRLLEAYHGDGLDPGDPALLERLAGEAGLDAGAAAEVVASGRFDAEVAEAEDFWRRNGITAVPTVVVNGRYAISGGQPVERFEKALRHIADEMAAEAAQGAGAGETTQGPGAAGG